MKVSKNIIKSAVVSLSLIIVSNTVFATTNTSVMQCTFKNGKMVQLIKQGDNLIYVYGKLNATAEAIIPTQADGNTSVKYATSSDSHMATNSYYRFVKGDYSYVVLNADGHMDGFNGTALGVFKGTKLIQVSKCKPDTVKTAPDFSWTQQVFPRVGDDSNSTILFDSEMMMKINNQ
ncbi:MULTISPECIES: hypothetical protein [Serratia]|uniref:hypothetical protein n=1 Tax=Serratia TaxID=613 RepID=UPI000A99DC20|nr:hypothetical protein [Serratia sp. 506_PEND]